MTVDGDVDYFLLSESGSGRSQPPVEVRTDDSSSIDEDVVRSSSSYVGMHGLSVYSSLPPPSPVTGLDVYALPQQEEEQGVSSEAQHDAAKVHVKNTTTNSGNDDNSPPIHHIHSHHHIITDPSRLRDSDNDMDGIRNFGMVDLDAEEVHIKIPKEKNGINQDNPIRYIPNDTGVEEGGGGGGEGDEEEIEAVAKAPDEEGKVICQNVDGDYGSFMTDGGVMVRYQYEVNIDSGVDINDVIPVIERRITDALLPVFFKDECIDEYSESSLRGGGGLRGGERRLQFKLSGIDMSPLDLPMDTGCGYPEPDPMSKCYVIEGGVTLHFPPNYSSEMFVQGAQLSTLNALRESMSYGHLNNAHSSIKKLRLSDSSYSEEPDVLTRDDLEKKDDGNGGRGLQILGILVGVGLMICCCFCGCGFLIWWRHKIAATDEDDSLGKTKLKKTKKKKKKTRSYSSDDEDEQSSMHRKKKKKRKHKKKKNLLLDGDDEEEGEVDGSNRRKLKSKDTFPLTRKMRDSSARSDPYSEQLIRDLKASEEMNAAVGDEGSVSSSVMRRRKRKKKKKMKRKKAKKKRSRETLDSDNTDTDNTNTDTDGENTKETTTSSDSTTDNSSTTGSKEAMSTTSSSGDDDDNNSTTTSGDDDDNDSTTTSTSEDEDEFDQSGGVMSQSNFVSQRRGIRQQQRQAQAGPPPTRFNFMKGRSERNYRIVFGSGGADGDDNESVMTGGTGMHSQASAATAQVKNMPSSGGSFFNDDTSVMTGISAKTQMMSNTGRAATPLASNFGNGSGSDSEPSNTGRSRVSDPSRHSSKHGSGSDSEPSNTGRSRVSDPSRHSSKHGSGSDSEPSNAGRSYGGTSRNSDPSRRSSDSEPSNAARNRFHTSLTSRQSTGSGSDSEPSNTSSIPANLRTSHGSDRRSFASKDSGPSRTSSR